MESVPHPRDICHLIRQLLKYVNVIHFFPFAPTPISLWSKFRVYSSLLFFQITFKIMVSISKRSQEGRDGERKGFDRRRVNVESNLGKQTSLPSLPSMASPSFTLCLWLGCHQLVYQHLTFCSTLSGFCVLLSTPPPAGTYAP